MQLVELQRWIPLILGQREGDRVAEHLPQPPGTQMPGIPGPDPLGLVAVHQLAKYRVDGVAKSADQRTPAQPGVPLRRSKGRQQSRTFLVQLFGQGWRPVVAVAD